MDKWIDLAGPVVADTAYCEGDLVGKDVAFTLPSISFETTDFRAMGTMSLPVMGRLEDMETSITSIGVDKGLRKILAFENKTIEYRWVQVVQKEDGRSATVGCKAFIRCIPKAIPGIGIEPGSASENESTHAVTRYQLFVGGEEYWLIDRLAGKLRIGGKDYYNAINSLL